MEPHGSGVVHPPTEDDRREPGWRLFDPLRDPHLDWDSPADHALFRDAPPDACLYYWRPPYWLRGARPRGRSPS